MIMSDDGYHKIENRLNYYSSGFFIPCIKWGLLHIDLYFCPKRVSRFFSFLPGNLSRFYCRNNGNKRYTQGLIRACLFQDAQSCRFRKGEHRTYRYQSRSCKPFFQARFLFQREFLPFPLRIFLHKLHLSLPLT